MRDLVHQQWATISFWLVNGALPLVALFALLGWVIPLQLAAAALGAGLILAAANIIGIMAPRKTPAQTPA
jgi:ABC-type multidrug transport system permease subunit